MTTLLVLVAFLALPGLASVRGWTADSRDPEFGIGPLLRPRSRPPAG